MSDAGAKKNESVAPIKANNGFHFFGSEVETMVASQRKNIEAMMQASRLALDGVQAVWRRQMKFVRDAIEGFTTLVGSVVQPIGPLKKRFAKHAEYSGQALGNNLRPLMS
jgi:Phasin protein